MKVRVTSLLPSAFIWMVPWKGDAFLPCSYGGCDVSQPCGSCSDPAKPWGLRQCAPQTTHNSRKHCRCVLPQDLIPHGMLWWSKCLLFCSKGIRSISDSSVVDMSPRRPGQCCLYTRKCHLQWLGLPGLYTKSVLTCDGVEEGPYSFFDMNEFGRLYLFPLTFKHTFDELNTQIVYYMYIWFLIAFPPKEIKAWLMYNSMTDLIDVQYRVYY